MLPNVTTVIGRINYFFITYFFFSGKSIQNLFNGARFIISNGLNSYFVKKGGAEKALEDFKSLKLDTKRRIVKGTVRLISLLLFSSPRVIEQTNQREPMIVT